MSMKVNKSSAITGRTERRISAVRETDSVKRKNETQKYVIFLPENPINSR